MNDVVSFLIEFLKSKSIITDLEKDLLDTFNEYVKKPFDKNSAERKIVENNAKYPEIFCAISTKSTTVVKSFSKATEDDIKYNLSQQIELLSTKELEVLNNEKNENAVR